MIYRMFIDDERHPVAPDWLMARTSYRAIHLVLCFGMPYEIAFDHDLGGSDTSINFISWLEEMLINRLIVIPENFTYTVHSQNPIGAKNIKSKMNQLIKHFKEKQ